MPINYSMFNRRADEDPEAAQESGFAKTPTGWRLLLSDDRKLLWGETNQQTFWQHRRSLMRTRPQIAVLGVLLGIGLAVIVALVTH